MVKIANKYHVSTGTIHKLLFNHGCTKRQKVRPTEEIRKMYKSGERIVDICRKYHISAPKLQDICVGLMPRNKKRIALEKAEKEEEMLRKVRSITNDIPVMYVCGTRYLDVTDHLDAAVKDTKNYYKISIA